MQDLFKVNSLIEKIKDDSIEIEKLKQDIEKLK